MAAGTEVRTVAEIEKAIRDREEQNRKDAEELVKAKEREALAKVENDIFFFFDNIRKNLDTLLDDMKTYLSGHCEKYNAAFTALRKQFRADVNELNHNCVVDCLTAYKDGQAEGQKTTAADFLSRLAAAFPEISGDLEKEKDR